MVAEQMSNLDTPQSSVAPRVRTKASPGDARNLNRRFVLQRLFGKTPTTRADIARDTGLTRATVSSLVSELLEEGVALELGQATAGRGKPPTLISISDDAYHIVTARLDGGLWTGSVMNLRRRVLETVDLPGEHRSGEDAVEGLCELIASLLASTRQQVLGIGISTPGVVTPSGVVVQAEDLDWHGVDASSTIQDRFSVPAHVINDAGANALAEYSLGDHQTHNLFVAKIGIGVGAGIILDGRPYTGEGHAAGEIGNMSVLSMPTEDSVVRTLEDVTSARAIAGELGLPRTATSDAESVFAEIGDLLAIGDANARSVVDVAGRYFGVVLAAATGILDIHHIVVTGPVTRLGDAFLAPAREELEKRVLPAVVPMVEISYGRVSRPEEQGAALLVLNREMGIL
jgi:predicted NBD/HSP70 family sugar kinase